MKNRVIHENSVMIGAVLGIVLQRLIGRDPGQRIDRVRLGLVVQFLEQPAAKLVDADLAAGIELLQVGACRVDLRLHRVALPLQRGALLVARDQGFGRDLGLRRAQFVALEIELGDRRLARRRAGLRTPPSAAWRIRSAARRRACRCWSAAVSGRAPRRSCRRRSAGSIRRSAGSRRADRLRAAPAPSSAARCPPSAPPATDREPGC